MTEYAVTIRLGSPTDEARWVRTVVVNVDLADESDVIVVDGLRASWSSNVDAWPAQPDPVTLSFSLWVPSAEARPVVDQGTPLHVTITEAAPAGVLPDLFDFAGRVTDVEAEPHNDGLRFDLTAVDHLAEPAEETLGDTPWPAQQWGERFVSIAQASSLWFDEDPRVPQGGWGIDQGAPMGTGYPCRQVARDVDAQPTASILEDLFSQVAAWQQQGANVQTPSNPQRGPWQRWNRPVLAYRYRGGEGDLGLAQYVVDYVGQGVTSATDTEAAALPYGLALDAQGRVALSLRGSAPRGGSWVPASAIVRRVKWRQDKAAAPNRVRLTNSVEWPGLAVFDLTRALDDQVEARGPVEVALSTSLSTDAFGQAVAAMYLGDTYSATPRFTFDEVTIRPDRIADPDFWPRLFPDPATGKTAAGRFVLVTGIPAKWNLYRRPDFPGRLTGADLEIRRGVMTLTAHIRHQVPNVNGPTGALTAAQLRARVDLGDPTPADFEPTISAVDLRLVGNY